ncbi:Hypothetical Protein FCC1311_081152 [Hondaea fermentalgiana]|uniref:Uncharacterized protein n=1 Tax=Hondaea fermentalgiana TaxID=2315210 RepID=A0A2R5GLY1_9STRA|nr:Hypothetical Protein FCC1311_081152 [Hondaea fermentalgiana]|eukprot:GBG31890.1 Hypothetical Protein FCC1311_081152 [Hondaea fermentalgiana]
MLASEPAANERKREQLKSMQIQLPQEGGMEDCKSLASKQDLHFDWDKAHLQLWNTFTHYAIHGDALQPNRLRAYEFTKFARDCGILNDAGNEPAAGSEASLLRVADINVLISAEVGKRSGSSKQTAAQSTKMHGSRRMTFQAFLNVVLKIALRLFPDASSAETALRLFVQSRLWRAQHRDPLRIAFVLQDAEVRKLLMRFESALRPIFHFYASAAEREVDQSSGNGKSCPKSPTGSFRTIAGTGNRMRDELSYQSFIELAKDFGLGASALLSMQSLGEAFLASIDYHAYHDKVPKMLYEEYIEALVRCALTIGRVAHEGATLADKLKHLLLIMWKAMTKRNQVASAVENHFVRTTYAADLLEGVRIFNIRFSELWAADGHRDYLSPLPDEVPDAFDLVQRLRTASAAAHPRLY